MAGQGRCSAMLSMVLLLVSAAAVVQGASYTVGDATGWKIPGVMGTSATYLQDWVANKTFVVGDTLTFVYTPNQHNVLTVSADAYTACTIANPLLRLTTGNDTVTLAAGTNYYVCGVGTHCSLGQKIAVNATAAPPGTITPPAAPGTPTTPAPGNSASGNAVVVFQVLAAVTVSLVGSLALW